jgi:hypothetical protein
VAGSCKHGNEPVGSPAKIKWYFHQHSINQISHKNSFYFRLVWFVICALVSGSVGRRFQGKESSRCEKSCAEKAD